MKIELEEDALIVLVGSIATGKSTFCDTYFAAHDVISSDDIRKQLTGNSENQECSKAAFDILYDTVEVRASHGYLTVIDSTGNQSVLDNILRIGKSFKRQLIIIKFPELEESEINETRFKHRWRFREVYYRMVDRIKNQRFDPEYIMYELGTDHKVTIERTSHAEMHTLDDSYSYVVIPDLHGNYKVLEHYIEKYKDDDNIKLISLGDIVDRGESSYKTFKLVMGLIADGKMDNVISNHDNKLFRYFKKWYADDERCYDLIDDAFKRYGMTIKHGLDGTIREFFLLGVDDMDDYADQFINYYETSHPYLIVKKEGVIHYFVHAGISGGVTRGSKMGKGDLAALMYETLTDPEYLYDICKHHETDVHVHTGHFHEFDTVTYHPDKSRTRWIIRHDIGLGKREVTDMPEFKVIE